MKRLVLTLAVTGLWLAMPAPALAIQGGPSTITFIDDSGNRHIHAFARGDSQHLVENYWDGVSWHWADHGLPFGATSITQPKAITYIDDAGSRRIYVFAITNAGKLVVNYWNGRSWNWANQGGPALFSPAFAVITYIDPLGYRRIYVFGVDDNTEHLVTNYWNGTTWQWADQGLPAGGKVTNADAITYVDEWGNRRIYVFCRGGVGTNFPLYVNYWDGSTWQWANHGGTGVRDISTVTYVDDVGERRIYAFANRDNSLYANYWNGFAWTWANLGTPAPGQIIYELSALTFIGEQGERRLYVFAEIGGGLYTKYWDGASWHWANQGLPAGNTGIYSPNAVSYVDSSGNRRIYVFCYGWGGHLVMNYWNGYSWQWADQGTM